MRVTAGLGLLLVILASGQVSPAQEGALGSVAEMPLIVGNEQPRRDDGSRWGSIGMTGETCPSIGYVIGRGRLTAADHELEDGSFSLSHELQTSNSKLQTARPVLSVIMPRGAVALLRADELNGRDVELVLREVAPRARQEIRR